MHFFPYSTSSGIAESKLALKLGVVFWESTFHHVSLVFFQAIEKWNVDKNLEELEQQGDKTRAEVAFFPADYGNVTS